jgi:hypothetical protein
MNRILFRRFIGRAVEFLGRDPCAEFETYDFDQSGRRSCLFERSTRITNVSGVETFRTLRKRMPQELKPTSVFVTISARLKSCPFKTVAATGN